MATAAVFIPAAECTRVALALTDLRAAIGPIPSQFLRAPATENLPPSDGRFDANRFLDVFQRLTLPVGYSLDYAYSFAGNGGHPLLYVRQSGSPEIATPSAHAQHLAQIRSRPAYLDRLQFAGADPVAALHLAWFTLEAPKFYLHWHAQYFDDELVVLPAQLEALLAHIPASASNPMQARRVIAEPARTALRALDLRPRVTLDPGGTGGEVTALAFGKWQGFHWRRTRFRRERAWLRREATVVEHSVEILAPYHCGIVF